jgi:hypothetical protein
MAKLILQCAYNFAVFFRNGWLHGLNPAVLTKNKKKSQFLPQWVHCSGIQGRVASSK